jgi:hypothetical protein
VSYTVSTFLKEAAGQGLTMLANLAYRLQTDLHVKGATIRIGWSNSNKNLPKREEGI